MQYLRGWRAMRQDPEWMGKVVIATVLLFVPLVGPLVLYGWQTLMLRRAVSGQDAPMPRLEFDMDYLMKLLQVGFKVYLVRLLWSLPVIGLLGTLLCCTYLGVTVSAVIGANGEDTIGVIGVVVTMITCCILYPVVMIGGSMPMQVAVTREELTDDLNGSMRFRDVLAMTKLIARELIVGNLAMLAVSLVAAMFGLVTCYIGLFPAMVVVAIIHTYWQAELYGAYLQKGGSPLPLGPLDVEAPQTYRAPTPPPY